MTLTKEDGSGLPDANSYASVADCNLYHEGHLYPSNWQTATEARKIAALVMATRMIDGEFQFFGSKSTSTQALQWPRTECPDPDFNSMTFPRLLGGNWIEENVVPKLVVDATCELARRLLEKDRTADPDGEGISSLSITGALSIVFDKTDRMDVATREVVNWLEKYGRQIGKSSGEVRVIRT
jgi:hypothetical protein